MKEGLPARIAARVQRAIVNIPRLGGRGVLVRGGFIVTVAHCVGWTAEGWMALHEDPRFYEKMEPSDGRSIIGSPVAVDPVSDIAVLGAVDSQVLPELADAFEQFCATARPVPLSLDQLTLGMSIDAYVFTHNKGVLPARVTQWSLGTATLLAHTDILIDGGTSGSPVVTPNGHLLGVYSAGGRAGERRVTSMGQSFVSILQCQFGWSVRWCRGSSPRGSARCSHPTCSHRADGRDGSQHGAWRN